jgi:hypothetical protein
MLPPVSLSSSIHSTTSPNPSPVYSHLISALFAAHGPTLAELKRAPGYRHASDVVHDRNPAVSYARCSRRRLTSYFPCPTLDVATQPPENTHPGFDRYHYAGALGDVVKARPMVRQRNAVNERMTEGGSNAP